MKKVILSLLMVAGVSAAFAQGTITFNSFGNANTALGRTFLNDGTSAPNNAFYGQLWWSDTGAAGTFTAAGTPQLFSSGTPNYVQDGSVAIPGHTAGAAVFIQMRVWNSAAGSTWAAAGFTGSNLDVAPGGNNAALTQYGITQAKSRQLAGTDTDGNIFSPQQFNNFQNLTLSLNPVPEPSTIALAGLGIASLLVFRRKK